MPIEFSRLRKNMFNMAYAHTGDRRLKLLNMMTKHWPFPSTNKISVLEIIGRDGSFKPILKLSPEYGYTLEKKIEDLQKNEDNANKPIEIPNFKQEFNKPNENENLRGKMTYRKLKKISKRKDPEVLKKRFIRKELAKRKKLGIRSVEFKLAYKHNDRIYGGSFTVYRNGSMRASGKFIDESVANDIQSFLHDKYGVPNDKLKYNNLTASFSMNAKPDLQKLVRMAPKPNITNKNIIQKTGKLKKPVERETARIVRGIAIIPLDMCVIRVSTTGNCQLENITSPSSYNTSFTLAKNFLTQYVTGPFGALPAQMNSKTRVEKYKQGEKAPGVLRRGTTCPKERCPTPYSFQGKCPKAGHYIKPNPQGQPCCYKIPASISYSKDKVTAAYKKADVKIPENVKKMFDLTNKNNALPNTTHSSNKNFINVFNDPTVNNAYIEDMNRLHNAWKSKRTANGMWTIRTRSGARATFEDPMALNAIIAKARGRKVWHVPDVSQLKIGTRQCTRYTKVALMDIATRLGIIEARPNMKKEVLCHLIRKATRGTNANKTAGLTDVTVSDEGKRGKINRTITGNGMGIRIGHRDAITFPFNKLSDFAKQLGAGAGREGLTREALVGLIADLTTAKRRALKKTIDNRKREANELAARRAANNARRAKEIANKEEANRVKEVSAKLKNLGLVNKKGRGQMNAVLPPAMYINLAANKTRRNAMRQNVVNMATATLKRNKIRPINLELTAKGQQKGVIKRFMKAFEAEIEAKYRPIYYDLLVNGNANLINKVRAFANTIPEGKKSKPSFKQVKTFADKLKKKAIKK